MSLWQKLKGRRWEGTRAKPGKVVVAKRDAYAAASKTRLQKDWQASAASPTSAVQQSLYDLRQRSLQLERDDGLARHASLTLSSLMSGILPWSAIPAVEDASPEEKARVDRLNDEVDSAFRRWSKVCVVQGRGLPYRAYQFRAVKGMIDSGGSYTIAYRKPRSSQLEIPLQMQLLSDVFCDHRNNQELKDGRWIQQGIEFAPPGEVVAYHFHAQYPRSRIAAARSTGLVRIEADRVAHLFAEMLTPPELVRGVPWSHAIMGAHRHLSKYLEAERVRMRATAAFMGFVRTSQEAFEGAGIDTEEGDDPANAVGIQPIRDSKGEVIERITAGELAYLREGQELEFNDPPKREGFSDYVGVEQHRIAAGWGLPYWMLTGDLTKVNYSAAKIGSGPFYRFMARMLLDTVVAKLGTPSWDWFIGAGKASAPHSTRARRRAASSTRVRLSTHSPDYAFKSLHRTRQDVVLPARPVT